MEMVCIVTQRRSTRTCQSCSLLQYLRLSCQTMSNLLIRSGQRNKIMRLLHRDLAVDEHIVNLTVFHQLPASAVLRLTIIYSSICTSHGHGSSSQLWKGLLETRVNIKVRSLRIWASQPCTRSPWITSNREAQDLMKHFNKPQQAKTTWWHYVNTKADVIRLQKKASIN